jgi:Family of unknown function (DUF5695)
MCDSAVLGGATVITPRDTYHIRVFLEPVGLWLVAEAGTFRSVEWDAAARQVHVEMESLDHATSLAGMASPPFDFLRLRVESASVDRPFAFSLVQPAGSHIVRGAYEVTPNNVTSETTRATLSY